MKIFKFINFIFLFSYYSILYSQDSTFYQYIGDKLLIEYHIDTVKFDTCKVLVHPYLGQYFAGRPENMTDGMSYSKNRAYYTDGWHLWKGNHTLIDTGFKGCYYNPSSETCDGDLAQGTQFLPIDNTHILFTNNFFAIHYNIIVNDSVIVKNVFVDSSKSEFMNALKHCNGRDYFLYYIQPIVHIPIDNFLSFKLKTLLVEKDGIHRISEQDFDKPLYYHGKIQFYSNSKLATSTTWSLSPKPWYIYIFKINRRNGYLDMKKEINDILLASYDAIIAEDDSIIYFITGYGNPSFNKFFLNRMNIRDYEDKFIILRNCRQTITKVI